MKAKKAVKVTARKQKRVLVKDAVKIEARIPGKTAIPVLAGPYILRNIRIALTDYYAEIEPEKNKTEIAQMVRAQMVFLHPGQPGLVAA